MAIGFTGTRDGLTAAQKTSLDLLLISLRQDHRSLAHGDCTGADEECHIIARREDYHIVVHPPDNNARRAFCAGDEFRPALPYLERNTAIVRECTCLIACPAEMTEQRRGGTWFTLRQARKRGIMVYLILPDGTITCEKGVSCAVPGVKCPQGVACDVAGNRVDPGSKVSQ